MKKFLSEFPLSTVTIITGMFAVMTAPFVDKVLQVSYQTLPLHWVELSAGWGLVAVGLAIRIIDRWKGDLK